MFRKLWNKLFSTTTENVAFNTIDTKIRKKTHKVTKEEEKVIRQAYTEMKSSNGFIEHSPKQLQTFKDFNNYVNNCLYIPISYSTTKRIVKGVRHQPVLPGMEAYLNNVA